MGPIFTRCKVCVHYQVNQVSFDCYMFYYRGRHSVKHFPITLTESGIIMGAKLFQTVPLLMEHFHSVPLLVDESGKAHTQ